MQEVAVLIPCYNEGMTVRKVVNDFKRVLPDAYIYVYDNNSIDNTVQEAEEAGAIVRYEYRQGKGNVVRHMFAEIDADIYILVDGDDTYPAESVTQMIKLISSGQADMVNGDRLSNGSYESSNKRAFHDFGNRLVKNFINFLFKSDVKDIMTGYRAYNKKFVKTWPIMSRGFEIETEMTIHALDKNFVIKEIPINYRDRPEGSFSKLNTFTDGMKVIKTVITIFKDYRPLAFFGLLALVVCLIGILCGSPVVYEYITQRYIYHIPLTILAAALEMLALNLLTCGFILDTVVKNDKKNYELRILEYMNK